MAENSTSSASSSTMSASAPSRAIRSSAPVMASRTAALALDTVSWTDSKSLWSVLAIALRLLTTLAASCRTGIISVFTRSANASPFSVARFAKRRSASAAGIAAATTAHSTNTSTALATPTTTGNHAGSGVTGTTYVKQLQAGGHKPILPAHARSPIHGRGRASALWDNPALGQ